MGLLLETYMPRLEPVTMAVLFCMDVLAKPLVESRRETLATDAARQMLLDAIAEAMMRGCMYKISRKYFKKLCDYLNTIQEKWNRWEISAEESNTFGKLSYWDADCGQLNVYPSPWCCRS